MYIMDFRFVVTMVILCSPNIYNKYLQNIYTEIIIITYDSLLKIHVKIYISTQF